MEKEAEKPSKSRAEKVIGAIRAMMVVGGIAFLWWQVSTDPLGPFGGGADRMTDQERWGMTFEDSSPPPTVAATHSQGAQSESGGSGHDITLYQRSYNDIDLACADMNTDNYGHRVTMDATKQEVVSASSVEQEIIQSGISTTRRLFIFQGNNLPIIVEFGSPVPKMANGSEMCYEIFIDGLQLSPLDY